MDARVLERPPRISLEQVGECWCLNLFSISLSSSDALKRDGRNKITGRRRADGWGDVKAVRAKYSQLESKSVFGLEPYTLMLPIFLRDLIVAKLYAPRST